MSKQAKIHLINLVVLATYMTILTSMYGGNVLLMSVWPILLHFIVNCTLSAIFYASEKNELGRTFILSATIVALVGFSSCWGCSIAGGGLRFN